MTTDSTVQNSSISTSSNSGGSSRDAAASASSNGHDGVGDSGVYGTPPDVIPNGHHGHLQHHHPHQNQPHHHHHPGLWDLAAAANPEHLGYELAATTGKWSGKPRSRQTSSDDHFFTNSIQNTQRWQTVRSGGPKTWTGLKIKIMYYRTKGQIPRRPVRDQFLTGPLKTSPKIGTCPADRAICV